MEVIQMVALVIHVYVGGSIPVDKYVIEYDMRRDQCLTVASQLYLASEFQPGLNFRCIPMKEFS